MNLRLGHKLVLGQPVEVYTIPAYLSITRFSYSYEFRLGLLGLINKFDLARLFTVPDGLIHLLVVKLMHPEHKEHGE